MVPGKAISLAKIVTGLILCYVSNQLPNIISILIPHGYDYEEV